MLEGDTYGVEKRHFIHGGSLLGVMCARAFVALCSWGTPQLHTRSELWIVCDWGPFRIFLTHLHGGLGMSAHVSGQRVGYARVSSAGQRLDRQVVAIGDVDKLFTDEVSGRSRADRPGLAGALSWLREGDTLVVPSMDRLARSLVDLEAVVDELTTRGVAVTFVKEAMTFGAGGPVDPFAVFQRQLIGAVAQLERSLIRERQREGIELAKARGVYRGRRKRLTPELVVEANARVASGVPKARVARDLGCSRRTLHDALHAVGAYAPETTSE